MKYFCNDCGIRFENVHLLHEKGDGVHRTHVKCSTCGSSKVQVDTPEKREQAKGSGLVVGDSFAGRIEVSPSQALPEGTSPAIPAGEEFLTKDKP